MARVATINDALVLLGATDARRGLHHAPSRTTRIVRPDGTGGRGRLVRLAVIDITSPASPHVVGSVDTPDDAFDVPVSGTYAHVAHRIRGFLVIDIADPANPRIVGSVDTPGSARRVAVSGIHAFVPDGLSLLVIDITDPTGPEIIGSANTPRASYVAVSGTHAYVGGDVSGVHVIDIRNLANPKLVGGVHPSNVSGVAVSGNYEYFAGWSTGVHVFPTQCSRGTSEIPPGGGQPGAPGPASSPRVSAWPNPVTGASRCASTYRPENP